jgi:hypothetical protein
MVLGLQADVITDYPHLEIDTVPLHEHRNFRVPVSLIDSVTIIYLKKVSGALRLPDPGVDHSGFNVDEILREAAQEFMMGLAYRADPERYGWWPRFPGDCTRIALTPYEGAEGIGTLVLAREGHGSIERVLEFTNQPRLQSTRRARKLLQLAHEGLMLHTNSEVILGLARVKKYDSKDEDVFLVKFMGHHHWQVIHNEQVLMGVKNGQPYLPKPDFDEGKLKQDLTRIFQNLTNNHTECLLSLVVEAIKEKHGTMLMISSDAKQESERLKSQSTAIAPKTMTAELLANLTSIDGAILLDPEGTCYAAGVILDGMASDEGDPARGARYNSAIRYIENSKSPRLAVIVSEDGGVDFVPDLRPMILRSSVERAICELRALLRGDSLNRREYLRVLHWLHDNSFYLLEKHCTEINVLMEKLDEKWSKEHPSGVQTSHSKFEPDSAMDPAYYYAPE